MALPKLDMGTVKDSEEKEKTTLRESMRKLSRKASASLRRGLTPRGSRHERRDSFDSLDEAADEVVAGAFGPESSQGSETLPPQGQPLSQPPLVEPPRPEHARLPQFEPAESAFSAAKEDASEGGKQELPAPADVAPLDSSASTQDIPPSKRAPEPADDSDWAPAPEPSKQQGDPAPHVEAPPHDRPDLPQFEDVSDAAAVTAAKASAWERVPSGAAAAEPTTGDAQEEAEAMVQDAPSSPRQGRPKWQEVALAVSIFAIGIIGAEPALNALRGRRQPQPPPIVDAKAAKQKGGWGFS